VRDRCRIGEEALHFALSPFDAGQRVYSFTHARIEDTTRTLRFGGRLRGWSIFGSRGNWTKWYRAGEAIEKVHTQFEKYADKLPTTRDALYEIALLQPDELPLCLENNYTRGSVTQPPQWFLRPEPGPYQC
jgi:hypothetical protein